MVRYETLLLTTPELSTELAEQLESQLEAVLREHGGVLLSYDRWGKYYLAFPVEKNDYGIYFLARFELDPARKTEALEAIRLFYAVRHAETVFRHVTKALDMEAPLMYARPQSLEEIPDESEEAAPVASEDGEIVAAA